MPLTLRPAERHELPAVLALWKDADAEPTLTDDEPSLARLLARDPGALVLALEDGRLVGTVIAAWDGWRGTLYRLAVAPGCRRRGIASRLVAHAERRLRGLGAARLQATVVASDAGATSFWRAGGWSENADRLRFTRTASL